jgi:prepilin-type N-terminal cleavage/methylation domain-containing protein
MCRGWLAQPWFVRTSITRLDKPTVAQKPSSARRGFTLIEMLIVVALMAILTAAVTLSLSGAVRSARIEDVMGQFIAFDHSTREIARRFARSRALRFDLIRGTVHRLDDNREAVPLLLGGGMTVTRVIVRDEIARFGEITVPFSDRGQSPSYAVLLSGPAGERWVTLAGLTGQAMVLIDERDVQEILSAATSDIVAGRADAR